MPTVFGVLECSLQLRGADYTQVHGSTVAVPGQDRMGLACANAVLAVYYS